MLKAVRGPLIPFVLFAVFSPLRTPAQQPAPAPPGTAQASHAQFFSGFVAELTASSLAVSRKLTGKEMVRKVFLRDAKTKVEGNLKAGARVTVRYESTPTGDRAIHIIVRG